MRAFMVFLRRLWHVGSSADAAISAERNRHDDVEDGYLRSAGWGGPDPRT